MPAHRRMTRRELSRWIEDWTESDRMIVERCLSALSQCDIYDAGGQVRVYVDGRVALLVNPGYLTWPTQFALELFDRSLPPSRLMQDAAHPGEWWYTFSNFRARGEHLPPQAERWGESCPTCWTLRSKDGHCACT